METGDKAKDRRDHG
jgi:hypothetical protein